MLIRYTWPALLWSLTVLILTLIPGKALPPVGFFQVDKLVHFFLFGVLMVLSSYAVRKSRAFKNAGIGQLWITTCYSAIFGIMIEIIQRFVPGRNFSFADIIANTIGVGLGYLIFIFLERRKII